MLKFLYETLLTGGINDFFAKTIIICAFLFILILSMYGSLLIANKYLQTLLTKVKKDNKSQLIRFITPNMIKKLAYIFPTIILYIFGNYIEHEIIPVGIKLANIINIIADIYLTIILSFIINDALIYLQDIYETYQVAKRNPIRAYIQAIKIILFILASIILVSIITNKSPWSFITGLGALLTMLLFVFKDTIIGFFTSIQLSTNDIIRIGDWISIPAQNAEGRVEEISLTCIKLRALNKSIITIPTGYILNNSVINSRGIEEAKGRRMVRSIFIDIESIIYCSKKDIEDFAKIKLLTGFIDKDYSQLKEKDQIELLNENSKTNLAFYREYIMQYLRHNKQLHQVNFPMQMREVDSSHGIKLEIEAFTLTVDWGESEVIQTDIIEHFLAALPLFKLKALQVAE